MAIKLDLPAEEMLRQLTEKVDIDLDEVKEQLKTVGEMENQLEKIESSQRTTQDAFKIALKHSKELYEILEKFSQRSNEQLFNNVSQ